MIEFGSDFHYCTEFSSTEENIFSKKEAVYFANGRQAIQHLLIHNKWKRIWIPTYFCYPVIDAIKETGIEVVFYDDSPFANDEILISDLNFKLGDVILRMNYFGLRKWRDNLKIPIPVIEDHSHDLYGEWVIKSNADWCIASVRKTIPVPEGGVLWSPKKHKIPNVLKSTIENDLLTHKRLSAMLLKTLYLDNKENNKKYFRKLYLETEDAFDNLSICRISETAKELLNSFDVNKWYQQKRNNWIQLVSMKSKIKVLEPEDISICNPFSFVLKFKDKKERDFIRGELIKIKIYPAILWEVPETKTSEIVEISNTLLSVHCDGRYNEYDIEVLRKKFEKILGSN